MPEIYLTRNLINNKKYIGQSIRNDKNYLGSGNLLKKAIKKYGKDNFLKEVIVSGDFNYNLLNDLEIHYICLYNANNSGEFYNLKQGGRNCGIPHTDKHKDRLKSWQDNPILKINADLERRREVIKKANEASRLRLSKKVYEFDENYKVIKTFNSVREASEFYEINQSCLAKCCRKNERNKIICSLHNHIFSYNNKILGKTFSEFMADRNKKVVVEYDENFDITKKFNSLEEACRHYSLHKESLRRHLFKRNKKNMTVLYLQDYNKLINEINANNNLFVLV